MMTDISPNVERRLTALWNEGLFDTVYRVTLDGYSVLTGLLKKCEAAKDRELIEWALPSIKSELADMNTFRAAKTAGEAA